MANKITKTQINYLEQKLNRVGDEKIQKFKEFHPQLSTTEVALAQINTGMVKLLPKTEIIKLFQREVDRKNNNYYYSNPSFELIGLISKEDADRIRETVNNQSKVVADYAQGVRQAIQNALDKIVLEGVDVDTAMQELDNI